MALPTDFNTGVVTGKYVDLSGDPVVGAVRFTPSVTRVVSVGTDTIVTAEPLTAVLDETGAFSITLPATDDPDITPNEWTYQVVEDFAHGATYFIDVPVGSTTDLAEVTPVDPSTGNPVVRTSGPKGVRVVDLTGSEPGDIPVDLSDLSSTVSSVLLLAPSGDSTINLTGFPASTARGTTVITAVTPTIEDSVALGFASALADHVLGESGDLASSSGVYIQVFAVPSRSGKWFFTEPGGTPSITILPPS